MLTKFKTQYRAPERHHTNAGSEEHTLYGAAFDSQGRLILKKTGVKNVYQEIQSYKDSVDINKIIKRFTEGELDVLSKAKGFYGDFSSMPTNYADLLNTLEDGKRGFFDMPVEVRAKFNHNFAEFMQAVSDGTFLEKVGEVVNEKTPEPSPEPVAEV